MFRRASILLCIAGVASAQEARDTARTPAVIVTATRLPLSRNALPVAVTVITAEDLRAKGIVSVADALADVTSAYVAQSGSQGAQTSLFLRGGESKYVKVLIDGIPVNDPGGVYDFGSLTTDNVERIEVVRGPASVVYGADAVTGVVNILTRRGQVSATDVDLRMGTMPRDRRLNATTAASATVDGSVSSRGLISGGAYSLSLARHLNQGLYETNNRYVSNVVSASYDISPSASTQVRLSGRYTDFKYDYPTNGGGDVTDSNAFRTEDRTALGVVIDRQLSPRNRATLALNMSQSDGGTDDQMDGAGGSSFVSLERTRRRGIELRGQSALRSNLTLSTGLAFEQQDQRTQFQSESSFGPFNDRFAASRRNLALYSEVVVQPVNTVTITLGLRGDSNEKFGLFGTGRGGISWQPVAATRVRATAGTAFREPTFLENYATGFVTGNPDLEPERTKTFDAGIDQEFAGGRLSGSVTGFMQRFTNMIDYDPASGCGFSYCNVAEATANGAEVEVRGRVFGPLSASVGATLLKTKVVEPGFDTTSAGLYRKGETLVRRPERKITGELAYHGSGRLSASLRALAVGIRPDRDFRSFTPVILPSYERYDFAAEYRVPMKQLTRSAITLRVENLANAYYENVFNFLAPRRTVSLGARSSF